MKISKNSFLKITAIIVLLMAVSCRNKEKPKRPPPVVTTAIVDQRDVPVYLGTIGQVISPVTVNIRPQVAGKLLEVFVQQGAIVEFGERLYTVDPRPYEAILDEAKAQLTHDVALLEIAQKTVERYAKVVEDDYISKLTWEQYESTATAAKAQVELDMASIRAAQINVDFCTVVAPVAGKISFYNVDVGNIVAVDDPTALTVIRPFSPIDILFSLSQEQFEMVRREQGDAGEWPFVSVLPESPTIKYEGTTFFLDNQINQDTGTILLKGRFPNEKRLLWPGEFVRTQVLQKIAKEALVVPPGAVLIGNNGPYVYKIDADKKAAAFNVNVLTRTEEYIALESKDIHKGDTVIIDGQINVASGIIVQPKSTSAASSETK